MNPVIVERSFYITAKMQWWTMTVIEAIILMLIATIIIQQVRINILKNRIKP